MTKYGHYIKAYVPLIGLGIVAIFFAIATQGAILSTVSIQSILNSTMTTALVAIGAVFIFGSGNFDISLGSNVAVSAVIGGYVAIGTGNIWLALLTCLVVALVIGLIKGIFAAFIDVPMFIVTLVIGFVLSAFILVLMGDDVSIYMNEAVSEIPSFDFAAMATINALVLGAYFILCLVLFNYTKLGREIKILGGNPITARQSGIDIKRVKITAFLISAIGCALAAFILLIRIRSVGTTTATSTGMDVVVALVLGGMPLSGGPLSRVSAGIIGAITISVLNAGLTMMNLDLSVIQTSRGLIFLVVVFLASMSYRTKLLTR